MKQKWLAYIGRFFSKAFAYGTKVEAKPKRIMPEGKLLRSEVVEVDGEQLYVEKVRFKDWHISLHNFYLISDRICDGHTIIGQKWDYNDFCNITVCFDDYTFVLLRQVECISLVRSYRAIPADEFDDIARPLIQ